MQLKLLKRIIIISFFFLVISLAYNQIIKGDYYFRLSQNNRIKLIRLPAPRGLIYDRNGEILADRKVVFNAAVLAQEVEDIRHVFEKIGPVLGISQEEFQRRFKRNFSTSFTPVAVARDVPKQTAIFLECKESDIPGLVIQAEPLRDYPFGESLCHLLGYLGRITEEELKEGKVYGLRYRDLTGRGGIEEEYDRYLRGRPGGMQVEVNNRGYKVKVLGLRQAQPGYNIHLTIDVKLQNLVDSLLEEKKGACIVMDPRNGEILAMASKPGFDPNLFIASLNEKQEAAGEVKNLLGSKSSPLLNRAISGVYPPGSIFKIVVACAGLETGKILPQDRLFCSGKILLGNEEFFCWKGDGHGSEDIYAAIAHSCNVFFYKLGLSLGPDTLSTFAREFGLGEPSGIDLPYEADGLVPSKRWKLKTKKERWYDGETVNFSIGQGYLLVTPLQIARMVACVANGGYLIQPHIVRKIGEKDLLFLKEKISVKKETLEVIREGMRRVVQVEGTGYNANIPGLQWAAKTGTAQTTGSLPHGWFAGFYPIKEPEILVLVFLEHGGSGGEFPARIAKEIIEYIHLQEEKLASKPLSQ